MMPYNTPTIGAGGEVKATKETEKAVGDLGAGSPGGVGLAS